MRDRAGPADLPRPADGRCPPLSIQVIGLALRTYRQRFWPVAATAFLTFGAVALVEVVATVLVADHHVSRPLGAAFTSVAAASFAAVGIVVYAGILDKVVGAHLHGHPDLPLRSIWRVLPLGRLIVADLILVAATVIGLALFVLPGVVLFTMWSLVGPVITIENRPVVSAFRRSCRLVRRNFWLTFGLVTVPIQIEQVVLHAIHYTEVFDHPLLPAFLINGLLGMLFGSIVGLIEVVLTYELMSNDLDRLGVSTTSPTGFEGLRVLDRPAHSAPVTPPDPASMEAG